MIITAHNKRHMTFLTNYSCTSYCCSYYGIQCGMSLPLTFALAVSYNDKWTSMTLYITVVGSTYLPTKYHWQFVQPSVDNLVQWCITFLCVINGNLARPCDPLYNNSIYPAWWLLHAS